MQLKYLVAILTIVFISVMAVSDTVKADVSYVWEYEATNLYPTGTDSLTYEFSSLDSATNYRWDLYTVNPQTGAIMQSLTFETLSGVVTGSVEFDIDYEQQGPLAVVDSSGVILGRHYVYPDPTLFPNSNSDWFTSNGNTALNDKQLIGSFNSFGPCENPVHQPVNADGWQHSFVPCSVGTQVGNYAIFHYQIDPTYVGPSDLKIEFYLIPDSTPLLTIDIDDIIAYQHTSGYSGGFSSANAYSFLIVNTSDQRLPFVDFSMELAAFVTEDDPMRADLGTGVYNYSRYDNTTWVSDGESVWIVTDDPAGNEWSVTASTDQVSVGRQQTIVTHAATENVWDSYHGAQSLTDVFSGFSDTTVYAFSTSRNHSYDVATSPVTGAVVQWTNQASALNSGLATPAEMAFDVFTSYDIVAVPTTEELINESLDNMGLNNPLGKAGVLMLLLTLGMICTAFLPGVNRHILPYLMVWLAIGGTFIVGGFSTPLISITYSIMTIGMMVFAVPMMLGERDNVSD